MLEIFNKFPDFLGIRQVHNEQKDVLNRDRKKKKVVKLFKKRYKLIFLKLKKYMYMVLKIKLCRMIQNGKPQK